MSVKPFDFRKIKKPTYPVILDDGTEIGVYMPEKGLLDELTESGDMLKKAQRGDGESIGMLYTMVARILSRNTKNLTITVEDVERMTEDVGDLIMFFKGYVSHLTTIAQSKN